jgi:sugar diacid utilization regulator
MLPPCEEQKMWIQFKIRIHTQIKKKTTITLMIANNSLRVRLSKLTAVLNEGPGILCHVLTVYVSMA